MRSSGDVPRGVLLLAPVGRDAEVGCAVLTRAGIDCRAGRGLADLDAVPLDELSALVLTEEVLTASTMEALCRRLDAQEPWSNLSVILLVDSARVQMTGDAGDRRRTLAARSGTILLLRPTNEQSFLSVVRAAVADRRRQFKLLEELEACEEAEARAQTLAREMKHRVKNAFSLALSIAGMSFRRAATLQDAEEAFIGRLQAMVRAQDLVEPGKDAAVDLRELAARTLAPYRPDAGAERLAIEGPRVLLPAEKAKALAMAFHELATNAAKYGALSAAGGRVALRWRVEPAPGGDELAVEWRERGGPSVSPPAHRGFGSRLVEKALAHDLGGSTELTFDPGGVVCTIRAPVPTVEAVSHRRPD
ncbi:sensor histidine kinase [Caenispirillum salinarum]|uniref:sensor histidine kinase n=1 Tax=Caenispirillum salinarum TaxID=859058 RepID=UPI00384A9F21